MSFEYIPCDSCSRYDDEDFCPLITGGCPANCNYFIGSIMKGDVDNEALLEAVFSAFNIKEV